MTVQYADAGRSKWYGRFVARVREVPSGCWEWIGAKKWSGYGNLHVDGKRITCPQAAWYLEHNEWPAGRFVLHSCDNRLCVNPAHLRLGTHYENIADATARNRWAKGERHGMCKFSESTVRKIAEAILSGQPTMGIAKKYGVSAPTVSDIRHGTRWAHITGFPNTRQKRSATPKHEISLSEYKSLVED